MLKLILKDFRANWKYENSLLILMLTLGFLYMLLILFKNVEIELYVMIIFISCIAFPKLFLILDELAGVTETIVSLPVSRRQIVKARYYSFIIQLSLTLFAHYIAIQLSYMLLSAQSNDAFNLLFDIRMWMVIGIVALLMECFAYPFYFKFGLWKGMITVAVIQFLMIVFLIFISRFFGDVVNTLVLIETTTTFIAQQEQWVTLIAFISFIALAFKLSMAISNMAYKNKDLV